MKRIRNVIMMLVLALSMSIIAPVSGEVSGVIVAEAAAKPKLSKTKVSVQKGKTYKLTIKNVKKGTKVKWSTSKKSVASIKVSGTSCVITARKAGTATVTAKIGKKSYRCKVTVKNPPIAISAKKQTVAVSKSFDLSIKNATAGVKWSTSNKKVATIKKVSKYKYRVTGKKVGKATITAKVRGKKYTCKVTVKPLATKLAVSGANSVLVGSTLQLKAVVSPRGSGGVIRWSSSNPKVATVSSSGLVRGISEGMVKITAVTSDGSKKGGSVTVTVKAAPKPVTPGETRPEAPVKPSTPETEPPKPVNPNPPQTEDPGSGEVTEKPNDKPVTPPQTEAPTEKPIEIEKPDVPPQTDAPVESEKPDVPPQTEAPTEKPIEIEKPDVPPQTDAPVESEKPDVPPQTEPNPPQTEAPYVSISASDENRTVEEGKEIVISLNTNCSNWTAKVEGTTISVESKTNNSVTVKGVTQGSSFLVFYANGVEQCFSQINVTERKSKIKLHIDSDKPFSLAGGEEIVVDYDVMVGDAPEVKVLGKNENVDILYTNRSGSIFSVYLIGRRAGKTQVEVSVGEDFVVIDVLVTSTDTEFFEYRSWIDNVLKGCGYGSLSSIEVFKNLGAWLVDNRSYNASFCTYYQLYKDGSGADCFGYTDLFVDVARRYYGYKADRSIDSGGHCTAVVEISDEKWGFDAGTDGLIGTRTFRIGNASGYSNIYATLSDGSRGWIK